MKSTRSLTSLIVASLILLSACGTEDTSQTVGNEQGIPEVDDRVDNTDEADTEQQDSNSFYFSYDDSASVAGFNLALKQLDAGIIPSPSIGRAYEFLNAEEFEHFDSIEAGPFDVSMGMLHHSINNTNLEEFAERQAYHLGIKVSGPTVTPEQRKNIVLTLLIDVSGSMESFSGYAQEDGDMNLLELVQFGLTQMTEQLKVGDIINVVTFSTEAEVILESWSFEPESPAYSLAVSGLHSQQSTNLNAGIELGYEVALRNYDNTKTNTLVIFTDAYANTGEVDATIISNSTSINEMEGISFSGVGIGISFQEGFLNELTEAGKGSYYSVVSRDDAINLFNKNLSSLFGTAVEDVVFKLTYPSELEHTSSAAEETSDQKSDIQPINFAYNSDQFFIESFTSSEILSEGNIIFSISYLGENKETINLPLETDLQSLIEKGESQILKALAIRTLAQLIAEDISCSEYEENASELLQSQSPEVIRYTNHIKTFCSLVSS